MEAGKFPFPLKLNNTFLNNQWIKKEIKWEIRKYLETTENKNCQTMESIESDTKGRIYSYNYLH